MGAYGTVIHPDGTIEEVSSRYKTWSSLRIKEILGGYFEIIPAQGIDSNEVMLADDEGKLKGLPRNMKAAELRFEMDMEYISEDQLWIVGPVLITKRNFLN